MRKNPLTAYLYISLFFTQLSIGQEPQAERSQKNAALMPYEIIVTPTMSRGDIRRLIVEIQDDFINKFNDANQDKKYDIVCYIHTPTMSRIQRRVCEPRFLFAARGQNAGLAAQGLANQGAEVVIVDERDLRWSARRDFEELEKKLNDYAKVDDEFREMARALQNAKDKLVNYGKD